jgi:hypothetical protein
MKTILYALVFAFFSSPLFAAEFQVFDAQFYNGLYYPRIDIIEWGEAQGELPHLEFHVYSKDRPIDLVGLAGDKNGKPVLWVMYDLKFRNEKVCRHVLAPSHFRDGMKLYSYINTSDPEYQNIYVSSEPRKEKNFVEYAMSEYQPCSDEYASNKPGPQAPAGGGERSPASVSPPPAASAAPAAGGKKDGKNIGVDYDNQAVPFSF